MFFQTYYDLISESRLPPASKFLDPYDLTAFTPKPGESLTNLIDRFQASREEKQLPQIIQAELKRLVVDSLYESTPTASRPEYFKEIKMPPNLSQMYTFTRATAKTLLNGRVIPASQRENRAKHCLNKCSFHSKSRHWAKPLTETIKSLVGIQESTVSDTEKSLGSCMACGGCNLQAKVGYTVESAIAGLNPEQIDAMLRAYGNKIFSQCWMMEEGIKDPFLRKLISAKISHIPNTTARAINALQFIKAASQSKE